MWNRPDWQGIKKLCEGHKYFLSRSLSRDKRCLHCNVTVRISSEKGFCASSQTTSCKLCSVLSTTSRKSLLFKLCAVSLKSAFNIQRKWFLGSSKYAPSTHETNPCSVVAATPNSSIRLIMRTQSACINCLRSSLVCAIAQHLASDQNALLLFIIAVYFTTGKFSNQAIIYPCNTV